jgi:hypothetical protein
MCLQKSTRVFLFLAVLTILGGCGALDSLLPSTGTYKISAKINDAPFNDFSIVTSNDKIRPFFEESVSEDPDITELVVFLKDSKGLTTGYRATYSLTYSDKDNNIGNGQGLQPGQNKSNDTEKTDKDKEDKGEPAEKTAVEEKIDIPENTKYVKNGNEIIFPVKSLDNALPFLPLPSDLPIGKYTLVFQVMSKNTVLYNFEIPLFYLDGARLSFEDVQVYLPGIAENSQSIQNGNVVLLDIKLDFDSRLDPYVVWYNGKKTIDEGKYSSGAGSLLWKAPDQNGFVSLSAEVFPSFEKAGLAGYQRGISLLVSSKEVDMHLLSKDTPNLVRWYTFEGDLTDSLAKDSKERAIEPAGNNRLKWMPSNGTYGLASGGDNEYSLPSFPLLINEKETWQIVSRFKLLSEGEIYSVQFGSVFDVTMTLSVNKTNIVLTLASPSKTYSETLKLPEEKDSFVTVSVKFFVQSGRLYAKQVLEKSGLAMDSLKDPPVNPISLEADIDKEFKIILGQQSNPADDAQAAAKQVAVQKQAFTAIWDELAILRLSAVEGESAQKDAKETLAEETPETINPPPPLDDGSK